MTTNSHTVANSAKPTKMCDQGTLVGHIWHTFDLVMVNVILSVDAINSRYNMQVAGIRKRLVVERNGVKFETMATVVTHRRSTFHLVVLSHSGVTSSSILKMATDFYSAGFAKHLRHTTLPKSD